MTFLFFNSPRITLLAVCIFLSFNASAVSAFDVPAHSKNWLPKDSFEKYTAKDTGVTSLDHMFDNSDEMKSKDKNDKKDKKPNGSHPNGLTTNNMTTNQSNSTAPSSHDERLVRNSPSSLCTPGDTAKVLGVIKKSNSTHSFLALEVQQYESSKIKENKNIFYLPAQKYLALKDHSLLDLSARHCQDSLSRIY